MPDDPPKPDPKPDDKTFTQADVDRIVADRLKRESTKYADYDELKAKAAKLDQVEETAKTDAQKAADRQAAADKRLADIESQIAAAEARALRAEVASAKKLTPAQAKRLQGTTREELESDADDLLESFPAAADANGGTQSPKTPTTNRPKERLRGGGEPDEPAEPNIGEIVKNIPRF